MLHIFRLFGTVTFLSLCHPPFIYMLRQSASPFFAHPSTQILIPPAFTIFTHAFNLSLCFHLPNFFHFHFLFNFLFLSGQYLVFCSAATKKLHAFLFREAMTRASYPCVTVTWETGREGSDRQRHRGTEWGEIGVFVTVNLMSLESGQPEQAADGRSPQQAHGATHLCPVLKQAHTPGP